VSAIVALESYHSPKKLTNHILLTSRVVITLRLCQSFRISRFISKHSRSGFWDTCSSAFRQAESFWPWPGAFAAPAWELAADRWRACVSSLADLAETLSGMRAYAM